MRHVSACVLGFSALAALAGCTTTDLKEYRPPPVGSGTSGTGGGTGGTVVVTAGNGGAAAAGGSGAMAGALGSSGGAKVPDAGAPADAAMTGGDGGRAGSSGTTANGGHVATSGGATAAGGRAPLQPTGCLDPTHQNDRCGNGVIDPGEQCEGTNLRGATCSDIDPFYTGTLYCGTDCDWDMTSCVWQNPCGNGVVDRGEDCEPGLFDAESAHPCADFPPHTGNPGNVTCNPATCRYDFSSCAGGQPKCGNGVVDPGEECDGYRSNILSCWSFHYAAGIIGRREDCTLDATGCLVCDGSRCGDGKIGGAEACDGTILQGQTCLSVGYTSGQIKCSRSCSLDSSGCHGCLITPKGNHCQ